MFFDLIVKKNTKFFKKTSEAFRQVLVTFLTLFDLGGGGGGGSSPWELS